MELHRESTAHHVCSARRASPIKQLCLDLAVGGADCAVGGDDLLSPPTKSLLLFSFIFTPPFLQNIQTLFFFHIHLFFFFLLPHHLFFIFFSFSPISSTHSPPPRPPPLPLLSLSLPPNFSSFPSSPLLSFLFPSFFFTYIFSLFLLFISSTTQPAQVQSQRAHIANETVRHQSPRACPATMT